MDDAEFWALIDVAREHDPSPEGMARFLTHRLESLDARTIQRFDDRFSRNMMGLYRWELWGVSALVFGHHGDQESFMKFRSWIVSLGHGAYEEAITDPDSLARHLVAKPDGEALCYVARTAYEKREGQELPTPTLDLFAEPRGEPIPASDLTTRFPKVAAALGL